MSRKENVLALFSKECVLQEVERFQELSKLQSVMIGTVDSLQAFYSNLPLLFAMQSSIRQSFNIIPQDDDNSFDWDSGQMTEAFNNAVQIVGDIPTFNAQTTCLELLLKASKWETARAYHISFYWFVTIGPQLASALVNKFQTNPTKLKDGLPLEKLAYHICEYVCFLSGKGGGKCLYLLFYHIFTLDFSSKPLTKATCQLVWCFTPPEE